MTHSPDDFDDDFQDAQVNQPGKKPGMAKNLGAAWNGSPLFKLFVLVVGVGALAAMVIGLLSGNNKAEKSGGVMIGSGPSISSTPGDVAPPAYVEAVNDASKKRADEANKAQTSAMPTPVSGDVSTTGLGNDEKESQYDPLAEFRPNIQPDNNVTQAPTQAQAEVIDSDLMSKMQSQMTSLFDTWRPSGIKVVQITDPATLARNNAEATAAAGATAPPTGSKILIPSGTVQYAQMIVEANSDIPGPILAEMMSGPFAGARLIGQFQTTHDYLILHFTKLSYHRKDYAIDAIALDPNTTLAGMVTEKDNRYFTRLILPAAAGFLEGFGSALSSVGSTTTVTNGVVIVDQGRQGVKEGVYRGLSDSASAASGFFREEASSVKPLIRVATGTPMGLFFVNSMVDSGNGPINTAVNIGPQTETSGPPLPPVGNIYGTYGTNTPLNSLLAPSGVTVISPNGAAQSPLANGGVSIIQSTPTR